MKLAVTSEFTKKIEEIRQEEKTRLGRQSFFDRYQLNRRRYHEWKTSGEASRDDLVRFFVALYHHRGLTPSDFVLPPETHRAVSSAVTQALWAPRETTAAVSETGAAPQVRTLPKIGGDRLLPCDTLYGRERELQWLDDAWNDPGTFLICVHGFGGVGKTTLVNKWRVSLADDLQSGVEQIFIWRFPELGPGERGQKSAEAFFDEALEFFNYAGPPLVKPKEKARALAELAAGVRALFILDQVESLQEPKLGTTRSATIGDDALVLFLELLSVQQVRSQCVLTTRLPPGDFNYVDAAGPKLGRPARYARMLHLEGITQSASEQLLRQKFALQGDASDFFRAWEVCQGNPLGLQLLGTALSGFAHGHSLRRLRTANFLRPQSPGQHNPAEAIIRYYESLLGEGPPLAVLRLLGLFNRPITRAELEALNRPQSIEFPDGQTTTMSVAQLANGLQPISADAFASAVGRLCALNILRWFNDERAGDAYDAHALVREYYAEHLRDEALSKDVRELTVWREGHACLYHYLKTELPARASTGQDLQHLVNAAAHGCRGGYHREVFEQIYWKRLAAGKHAFHARPTGQSFPKFLDCLAHFFSTPWQTLSDRARPAHAVTLPQQANLLGDAGHYLFLTGRLDEAAPLLEQSIELRKRELGGELFRLGAVTDDQAVALRQGAKHARLRREIALVRGEIHQAHWWAAASLAFGAKLPKASDSVPELAGMAQVLHYLGDAEAAQAAFDHAEKIADPARGIDSFGCSWYCEFLLDEFERRRFTSSPAHTNILDDVERRAAAMLRTAEDRGYAIDRGLAHLALARAMVLRRRSDDVNLSAQAYAHVAAAASVLQDAGQQHHLAAGLLSRAATLRELGRWEEAVVDIEQAERVAQRANMTLYQIDALLERARLALSQVQSVPLKPSETVPTYRQARFLVNEAARLIVRGHAAPYSQIEYRRRLWLFQRLDAVLGPWRSPGDGVYHTQAFCPTAPFATATEIELGAGGKLQCSNCRNLELTAAAASTPAT